MLASHPFRTPTQHKHEHPSGALTGECAAPPVMVRFKPSEALHALVAGCSLPKACRVCGTGPTFNAALDVPARLLSLNWRDGQFIESRRDGHSAHLRMGKTLRQRRSHDGTTSTGSPVARPQSHTDRFQRQMCALGGLDEIEAGKDRLFVS